MTPKLVTLSAAFSTFPRSLLITVLALWARRALLFAAVFALIWVCLVIFSCLATHATVTTAISAIERTGTWKMEIRSNTKAELAAVEQQLAALSRPAVPRPAKTVREELTATSVPPSAWKDSKECNGIQESVYFQRACAQVVRLRRELVATQEYERLSARAGELRKGLADAHRGHVRSASRGV
jgi:dihydroxyacetone kinase-like predicted kinase